MKSLTSKILVFLLLGFFVFQATPIVLADPAGGGAATNPSLNTLPSPTSPPTEGNSGGDSSLQTVKLNYPLPGVGTGKNAAPLNEVDVSNIEPLIKYAFNLLYGLGAMIAVVSIAIGGLQKMAAGASIGSAKAGDDRIMDAIFGLVLLLSGFLILRTINPQILSTAGNILKTIPPMPKIRKANTLTDEKLATPVADFRKQQDEKNKKSVEDELKNKTDEEKKKICEDGINNTQYAIDNVNNRLSTEVEYMRKALDAMQPGLGERMLTDNSPTSLQNFLHSQPGIGGTILGGIGYTIDMDSFSLRIVGKTLTGIGGFVYTGFTGNHIDSPEELKADFEASSRAVNSQIRYKIDNQSRNEAYKTACKDVPGI